MEDERCPMSNPAQPHNLSRRIGVNTESACYGCGRKEYLSHKKYHYHCESCEVEFHYCCHRFPEKIIHPYHLQHPFTLIDQKDEIPILDKCSWCGNSMDTFFYHCFICNFSVDRFCIQNNPPLTIQNPKSHHHPLSFFPRPLLISCDACGSVDVKEPSYVCLQCNYIVHKSCIDLPRVIKITRHPHRLYHTPYLPPKNPTTLCRICYKTVDIKYGMYSCNLGDCTYVAHAKCATHRRVWDMSELEWEPEEADETDEVIQSFKKVGDDLIKHVCHEHYLRVKKHDGVQVVAEQCQVCILPINFQDFYSCIQCEFFLHKVCAHLPKKLNHALHKHPLRICPSHVGKSQTSCSACSKKISGLMYICGKIDCSSQGFLEFDVCCILVPEYFTHKSHIHPIFISTSHGEYDSFLCKVCKKRCSSSHLQCTVCEFTMCYECATIPEEIYYKYDKHPLVLCYGEESIDGKYWCEICEKELDSSKWFYTCDKCCITIHRECLFGSSIYMKYGFKFRNKFYGEVEVIRNNGSTRAICCTCHQRCPDFIYFKIFEKPICCRCFK